VRRSVESSSSEVRLRAPPITLKSNSRSSCVALRAAFKRATAAW